MKFKNLLITILVISGFLFLLPSEARAGTYQCNPYQCNPYTCGCITVTSASKCGSTTTCGCYYSGNGACCDGYYLPFSPYSFVCIARQECTTEANTCTIGCTTCYDTCYETCCDELNTNPSQPASETITSDEGTYSLSLDIDNPTAVNLTNATVTLPELTPPATSSGVGYQFRFYDPSGTLLDTIESTSRTQNIPAAVIATMNTGEVSKVSGLYYTIDECDTDKQYGTPIEGYITTNNEPDPLCIGAGCTPSTFIVGLGSDITTNGCVSEEYTGKEINNPLHLNMSVTDTDGVDEVEALIVWFSTDTATPNTTEIVANHTGTNTSDVALMIRKNGTWDNPTTYALNDDNTWAVITDGIITNTTGTNLMSITSIITTQTTSVEFDFQLELRTSDTPMSGIYNIYAKGIDSSMISGTTVSHPSMTNIFDFGVDLQDPTVDNVSKTPIDAENVTISWESEDLQSSILTAIINGYVNTNDPNILAEGIFLNSLQIPNPITPPDESLRGLFSDVGITALQLNTDEEVNLDIGYNEVGQVYVSITAYDLGCNYANNEENVSLEPWVSTQGGYFYSKEAVTSDAVDISSAIELISKFQRFDISTISQGTEILSARTNYVYQLIHADVLESVSAVSIYDSNNQKTYWFNHLYNMLDTTSNLADPNDECTEEACYYITEDDINFGTDFECTGNTMYISEGNITIHPKTIATATTNSLTGCIYIAKEDITFTNTGHAITGEEINYDYLEGFFIAEDQIIINAGTSDEDKKYGLEIEGSLIAIGRDNISSNAIVNNRTLKAYNAISPSLLVSYHPKYSKIAQNLIGDEAYIFIQEIAGGKN